MFPNHDRATDLASGRVCQSLVALNNFKPEPQAARPPPAGSTYCHAYIFTPFPAPTYIALRGSECWISFNSPTRYKSDGILVKMAF